ncbi:MAG: hypothetical protein KJ792_03640 [Actinobacteria bacterium]|nr:hypothetical protein [Actinomycetota bacterium]MCG2803416.1 hypothetical protein [Cellulomonas sp.]
MGTDDVTAALHGWEDRLRGLGAVAVDCLRPGLSRDEVDALAAEFEGGLPEGASAIWRWHDGSDHGDAPSPGLRGLVPYRFFVPLREAFAQARQLYKMTSAPMSSLDKPARASEDLTVRYVYPEDVEEPPGAAFWYRPWWLVFLSGGGTTFVECARTDSPETVVGLWDPHGERLGALAWAAAGSVTRNPGVNRTCSSPGRADARWAWRSSSSGVMPRRHHRHEWARLAVAVAHRCEDLLG